ncbi:MAG: hypothetical protein ACHRHE_22345, partial [Tepidisphaerales bacterium]
YSTQVSDAGLVHIGELKGLQCLVLSGPKVTDAGLVHLKQLKSLQWLDLHYTKVTEVGAKALQASLPGTTINWP